MSSNESPAPRRRLSREDRLRQLLDVAWQLVRDEGTDALTLGRLAELAGVTKPVVYDHFATRAGLLAALYADFDERQDQVFADAIATSKATLEDRAWVIASSYVDCVLLQGREIPGVIAALSGSPELEASKREYEAIFLDKCKTRCRPSPTAAVFPRPGCAPCSARRKPCPMRRPMVRSAARKLSRNCWRLSSGWSCASGRRQTALDEQLRLARQLVQVPITLFLRIDHGALAVFLQQVGVDLPHFQRAVD